MMNSGRGRIKIWGFLMISLIMVSLFPTFSPYLDHPKNLVVIFYLAAAILATRVVFEVWQIFLKKRGKEVEGLVKLRLVIDLVFISVFLYFFDRINGPLFFLYLLVVLEALWEKEIYLATVFVVTMVFMTTAEFVWLAVASGVELNFVFFISYFFRMFSLIFIHFYGQFLRNEFDVEEEERAKSKKLIVRLKNLGEEIKKTNVKLKEMSALKDDFVSVASHELRAPMTMIKGFISMVLEGNAGRISEKARGFLTDAYESNDRMVRLVNNMLNVSRIESGRMVMNLVDIRVGPIVEDIVAGFKMEAKKHGLKLIFSPLKKKMPRVRIDPDRIREVLTNLISNAINFTPHGRIDVRCLVEDGFVRIEVEDTGVGIAPEDQSELFKKFSQLEMAAAFKKGSGLGLYICRMLINEFGGKIWVKSKVGKGTTFFFTLPVINHNI